MTNFDVRHCTNHQEMKAAMGVLGQYFGPLPTDEMVSRFQQFLPTERVLSARDGDLVIGGAGSFAFQMSAPGAWLPCAGVTIVGVSPTHRRRGVLTAMMRAQLEDIHRRGEPIAALWASDERIYGRFGYGLASRQGPISIARREASFHRALDAGALRFVELAEAKEIFPRLWEKVGDSRSGFFRRSPEWWELRVLSENPARPSPSPKRLVLLEEGGAPTGYAIYRHLSGWSNGQMSAKLQVIEALGVSPSALAKVWRYLLDIDWIDTIEAEHIPHDHPLFFLLEQPRRMQLKVFDALWVRLVDVAAALSSRSYTSGEPITFAVKDNTCPWNEGRYLLRDGVAARSEQAPDITCDVSALGAVFLGSTTFDELHGAGLITEETPGAVERATRIFRARRHAWCPEIF